MIERMLLTFIDKKYSKNLLKIFFKKSWHNYCKTNRVEKQAQCFITHHAIIQIKTNKFKEVI